MAGYLGSRIIVAKVDGYNKDEADTAFANVNTGTSFPAEPQVGDICLRTDLDLMFKYTGTEWIEE